MERFWEGPGKVGMRIVVRNMPGQTGPKTPEGKANSSQNARKHGMRSRKLIVGDERQEDYDRLAAGWRAEFEPEGQAGESLIERVILGDWFLQRAEGAYMDAEAELAETPALGRTAEQHAQVQLYLRYKTAHERSFYRAFYALRGLRKDKWREELDLMRVREVVRQEARTQVRQAAQEVREEAAARSLAAPKKAGSVKAEGARAVEESRGKALFKGQNHPKKMRKVAVLDQWIEVEIQDGKTVTKLYPSNAGLIEAGQAMDPPPDLVYRRLNFPHGIPEEYLWAAGTGASAERRARGGMGTQRMTVDTWLDVIDREEANGTGHVGPTGVGNLPRPKERGECDCEVCRENREAMETA
jgi:hypothetical protein